MTSKKTCDWRLCAYSECGYQFFPTRPNQIYHTLDCRTAAGQAVRRAKQATPKCHTCKLQGCDVVFKKRHHLQEYCTHAHRMIVKRQRDVAAVRNRREEARASAQQQRGLPAIRCHGHACSVMFVPSRPSHLYHSVECRQQTHNWIWAEKRKAERQGVPLAPETAPAPEPMYALRYNAETRRMEQYKVPTTLLPQGGGKQFKNRQASTGGDTHGWTDVANLMMLGSQ